MVMEWFQHINITNCSIFLTKRAIFFKFFDIFIIQVYPDSGARKHPNGFDDNLMTNFYWPWKRSSFFLMSQILAIFFIKLAFFKFSIFVSFFRFL